MSLPPDGYQGILEEYRRLRLDVQERHEARLYLGMQAFRMWLLMSGGGRSQVSEEQARETLQDALSALESQDHNGYQRLRSKLRLFAGDGLETPALEFFVPRVVEMEPPRFAKGEEIPKPEDIMVGLLHTYVVEPLARDLGAEDWQGQSLKESMAMKAALWAATESNTTKITREKRERAAASQLALWGLALVMLLGMGFAGWKMGLFFGKNADPAVAMTMAKQAMKKSDFEAAVAHAEEALELLVERRGNKKETRPVRELLVEAYVKSGRKDRARDVLVELKSDFPQEKRYPKRIKELDAAQKPSKKK